MILFLLNHSRFTIDIRYIPGTKYKLWNLVIVLFIIFIHQQKFIDTMMVNFLNNMMNITKYQKIIYKMNLNIKYFFAFLLL